MPRRIAERMQRLARKNAALPAPDVRPSFGRCDGCGRVPGVCNILQRYEQRIPILLKSWVIRNGVLVGEEDVGQQHRPHQHKGKHHRSNAAAHQGRLCQPCPKRAQRLRTE